MVPRSLCNKLTVTFGIVLLSFEIILGTCIKRDEQIQKYLTSSESPFDNYFNISRAVYPSVDLPSLLINISVVFRKTANEKSNGSNCWSTLERNVSRSTLNFTWSMSCLYVSGGEISLESMKWFSLGAIFPNRRKRGLHITLPELCRDSPVEINKTMEYFLSTVNDHSELSNVFLSRFSFVVLTFSKESEGGGTGGKGRRSTPLLTLFPPALLFAPSSTGKRVHRLVKELGLCRSTVYLVGPWADHTMCLWLIIVDMRRIKSMRVINCSEAVKRRKGDSSFNDLQLKVIS